MPLGVFLICGAFIAGCAALIGAGYKAMTDSDRSHQSARSAGGGTTRSWRAWASNQPGEDPVAKKREVDQWTREAVGSPPPTRANVVM